MSHHLYIDRARQIVGRLIIWLCVAVPVGSASNLAAGFGAAAGDGDPFEGLPPLLMFSNPANGATGISTNSPVVFTFSTAMKRTENVTWGANLTPAKFVYNWSADNKTLTCQYVGGFPANTPITWTLDPANFASTSDVPIFEINNSGTFTTGSAGSGTGSQPDPCVPTNTPADGGAFSVTKYISYIQNSANPPVVNPELGAIFSAMVSSPTNNPVTEATVSLPDGSTRTLTTFPFLPQLFQFVHKSNSQAELDAAFPTGTYTVTVRRKDGSTAAAALSVPDGVTVPVPHLSNYAQLQGFDPAADLLVLWSPFTGGGALDSIALSLNDRSGAVFHAPDFCIPRELKVTDISIVVPKKTFGIGEIMDGALTFSKTGTQDTNSIAGLFGYSGFSRSTTFEGRTAAGSQSSPQFTSISASASAGFQATITAPAGSTVVIEASTDLRTWTPVLTSTAPSGVVNFSEPISPLVPYRFYRIGSRAGGS